MRRVITCTFLVSLPLIVLGCTGNGPLGPEENARPPLFKMDNGPVGMVSGQVGFGSPGLDFNIQARRVPTGQGLGVIRWSGTGLRVVERVTCLEIDGNLAWANTVVTSTTPSNVVSEGATHTWIFRDGPDALQAEFSFLADCTTKPPVTDFTSFDFVLLSRGDLTISNGT